MYVEMKYESAKNVWLIKSLRSEYFCLYLQIPSRSVVISINSYMHYIHIFAHENGLINKNLNKLFSII